MQADARHCNVLLINVDQWSGNFLSCMGSKVMTPTIDSMRMIGTQFVNAYSSTPVCIPARREILCGCDAKTHGDRTFDVTKEMPKGMPTIAEVFKSAGYQTFAVGKLHVYPQRSRAGFDDVLLMEEGRHYQDVKFDDYERYLMLNGKTGEEYGHCMCNNDYLVNQWHLEDKFHPTNWITRQMCETILRRDSSRPSFWYLSYNHPHPPLAPLKQYLDLYENMEIDLPPVGDWASQQQEGPEFCKNYWNLFAHMQDPEMVKRAIKGYFALCTHIDHQIRLVLGTLREQGLLDNTAIAFIADHGEMLGTHNLWQKNVFYENSTKIPCVIVPPAGSSKLREHYRDERLVQLRDIMPTLLDIAGIPIPESVNGMSLAIDGKEYSRDYIYGELWEDIRASRMIRKGTYKLIYSPYGNRFQLFDLEQDPCECRDLSMVPEKKVVKEELARILVANLYGQDLSWLNEQGCLVGCDIVENNTNVLGKHDFLLQRGYR